MDSVPTRHMLPVLMRAAVWSLIGMIYAPLYLVLTDFLTPTLGAFACIAAASAAGGIGAAFYGARQLALTASVIGVGCAFLALAAVDAGVRPWVLSLATLVPSLVVGFLVRFPRRCTADVELKVAAGLAMGAVAGALLLGADRLAGVVLPDAAAAAFLVSVTGVLYVSVLVVRPVRTDAVRGRFCDLTEGLVIAIIALVAANGLVAFAGIFDHDNGTGALTASLLRVFEALPVTLPAAMFAGAIAGGLLELFEFDWVDRV